MIENPAFMDHLTAKENLQLLSLVRRVADEKAIDQALNEVGLSPRDKRPFRKFSLGMKRRLGIAAALFENPRLVVLDEPTNGVDAVGMEELRNLFVRHRDRGALVVMASHDADELNSLADQIVQIKDGRIISDGLPRRGMR